MVFNLEVKHDRLDIHIGRCRCRFILNWKQGNLLKLVGIIPQACNVAPALRGDNRNVKERMVKKRHSRVRIDKEEEAWKME